MNRRKKLEDKLGGIFSNSVGKRVERALVSPDMDSSLHVSPEDPEIKKQTTRKAKNQAKKLSPKNDNHLSENGQKDTHLGITDSISEKEEETISTDEELSYPVFLPEISGLNESTDNLSEAEKVPSDLIRTQDIQSRALALSESTDPDIQILVFKLEDTFYGVDISSVQTIIKPQTIYLVPGTAQYIKGVINLRGNVVPVIDLRNRFGLPTIEFSSSTRFVIVELEDLMASLIVDAVQGVEILSTGMIENPSSLVMDANTGFLKGIARFEKWLILMLDLEQTLKGVMQEV